jgi:hypothetical protein
MHSLLDLPRSQSTELQRLATSSDFHSLSICGARSIWRRSRALFLAIAADHHRHLVDARIRYHCSDSLIGTARKILRVDARFERRPTAAHRLLTLVAVSCVSAGNFHGVRIIPLSAR